MEMNIKKWSDEKMKKKKSNAEKRKASRKRRILFKRIRALFLLGLLGFGLVWGILQIKEYNTLSSEVVGFTVNKTVEIKAGNEYKSANFNGNILIADSKTLTLYESDKKNEVFFDIPINVLKMQLLVSGNMIYVADQEKNIVFAYDEKLNLKAEILVKGTFLYAITDNKGYIGIKSLYGQEEMVSFIDDRGKKVGEIKSAENNKISGFDFNSKENLVVYSKILTGEKTGTNISLCDLAGNITGAKWVEGAELSEVHITKKKTILACGNNEVLSMNLEKEVKWRTALNSTQRWFDLDSSKLFTVDSEPDKTEKNKDKKKEVAATPGTEVATTPEGTPSSEVAPVSETTPVPKNSILTLVDSKGKITKKIPLKEAVTNGSTAKGQILFYTSNKILKVKGNKIKVVESEKETINNAVFTDNANIIVSTPTRVRNIELN